MEIDFFENTLDRKPIPEWAEFLINFGLNWPRNNLAERRIALISMPCDSPAAGLIALGALINGLNDPEANDFTGHYHSLIKYARQYLKSCRKCRSRCNPEQVRCGYNSEANGEVRYYGNRTSGRIWTISEETDFTKNKIKFKKGSTIWSPDPKNSFEWQIRGLSPVSSNSAYKPIIKDVYQSILTGEAILDDNLTRTYSGLCFAGRQRGEKPTYEYYSKYSLALSGNKNIYSLSELLTIDKWSDTNRISRISFSNKGSEDIDRYEYEPSLTIADSDTTFLRVIDWTGMTGDVIGIYNRMISRENLELIGNKLSEKKAYYLEDYDLLNNMPNLPRGMYITILRKEI